MAILFFIAVIIGSFAAGCGLVPGMLILLRSVPPARRSISLGLQGFLVSSIGTLPSPIIWGVIVDSTCLLWDHHCGSTGSCLIYDPETFRVRMHLTYAFIRLISTLNDLFVFYHAKGLTLMDEDEENVAEDQVIKENNIQMSVLPQ
jgi:MFS family permease